MLTLNIKQLYYSMVKVEKIIYKVKIEQELKWKVTLSKWAYMWLFPSSSISIPLSILTNSVLKLVDGQGR